MPEKLRPIDGDLLAYVRDHTTAEDPFLRELRAAAVEAGIPGIWIAPEQGAFLQILLRSLGAREVVEVGTLCGVSALWMARALPPDGRVRTVEIEARHANFAETWLARSDVAGMVEVHRGDGREVLPSFGDRSADLAFLDADKPGYATYFEECLRIVRPGGVICVDNAFAFGELLSPDVPADSSVHAVRAFNERIAADGRVQAVIVPLGDGMWVAHVPAIP